MLPSLIFHLLFELVSLQTSQKSPENKKITIKKKKKAIKNCSIELFRNTKIKGEVVILIYMSKNE